MTWYILDLPKACEERLYYAIKIEDATWGFQDWSGLSQDPWMDISSVDGPTTIRFSASSDVLDRILDLEKKLSRLALCRRFSWHSAVGQTQSSSGSALGKRPLDITDLPINVSKIKLFTNTALHDLAITSQLSAFLGMIEVMIACVTMNITLLYCFMINETCVTNTLVLLIHHARDCVVTERLGLATFWM